MIAARLLLCLLLPFVEQTVLGSSQDHQRLVDESLSRFQSILDSDFGPCDKCLAGMDLGHQIATESPKVVPDALIKFCKLNSHRSKVHKHLCKHSFGRSTVDTEGLGDDISNVLALMDPNSLDARYACYYQVAQACPLPAVPNFDLSGWWPPKPEDAREPESAGESFNVLHISDFHVDLDYAIGGESNCSQSMCCTPHSYHKAVADDVIQLPARTYGGYACDSPKDLLQSSMDSVAAVHADKSFEFAIFTGDMVDHEDQQYRTLADATESEKVSYKLMKQAIEEIPFYITLGNHDSYPYGQIAQAKSGHETRFSWNTELAYDMWTDFNWLTEDQATSAKSHYAAFSVTTKRQGLRVISLNSNFWYIANYYNYWATETDSDPSGMFRFLSDELLDCEKTGQRAWVIAHVPPGGTLGESLPAPSQVFYQILERFSPHVVAAVFLGHTHRDEFQVLYSHNATEKSAERALNVAFLDESVTPYKDHNPGWRYYEIDSSTYSVLDIHHYYSRLNETFGVGLNGTGDSLPVWEYGYSARTVYDPESFWPQKAPLNATFWHHVIHDKIMKSQAYRDMYESFAHRQAPNGGSGCRSPKCLHELYCYMTTFSVPQAAECLARNPVGRFSGSFGAISSGYPWLTDWSIDLIGALGFIALIGALSLLCVTLCTIGRKRNRGYEALP